MDSVDYDEAAGALQEFGEAAKNFAEAWDEWRVALMDHLHDYINTLVACRMHQIALGRDIASVATTPERMN